MKIVCESCSAKYSIADDKIAGKVFKIRCKKCGSNIEVHGDTASPAAASGRPSFDYGGVAIWHVMVDGEQQGPFAPEQIGAMITSEKIGWDAYVWREGLDEWKAASDVEELAQAIMGTGAAAKSPSTKGSGAAADLFAKGDDDDDVVASAPSAPRAASPAATGARNESSVLFSLSNLQSMAATGPSGGATSSSSKGAALTAGKGAGADDASGLVDIRALASATGLLGGAGAGGAKTGPAKAAKVDDLLSIGAPSGGLGSPLGAPVIIAQKEEPARGGGSGGTIAAAAIVAIAVLGGAGIFAYASLHQPAPTTAVAPVPTTEVAPPPPTTAIVAPPPTTTVAAPASTVPPPSTTVAHHHGTGTAPHTTTAGTDTPVTPPPATHTSGTESLEDLIAHAAHPTHTGTTTPPASAAGPSLPTTPSASDVRAAMAAVQPAVTACGAGAHGVATVQVVIAGATGRVSNATVSGDFAGTPVGSCVARAVRTATFPHFSQTSFSIGYPFRI